MILDVATNATAEIAYSNINLVTGCISVILALVTTVIYLYKRLESKNDLFIAELRDSNAKLMNICDSYNQYVQKMDKIIELIVDSKSSKK